MKNRIIANDISIVIPVKDNQQGIDRYIKVLFEQTPFEYLPKEIIIVDNNSQSPTTVCNDYPVPIVVLTCTTPGPASARNTGVRACTGSWILFNDSDCIPTQSTISGYCIDNPQHKLAFQGMYHATNYDHLSRFYASHLCSFPLCPIDFTTMDRDVMDWEPSFLVTANCLINREFFNELGGFDENIRLVASEDLELGVRVKRNTKFSICQNSIILHEMTGGMEGFNSRYIRYGRGARYCCDKHPETITKYGPYRIDTNQFKSGKGFDTTLLYLSYLNYHLGFMMGLPKTS